VSYLCVLCVCMSYLEFGAVVRGGPVGVPRVGLADDEDECEARDDHENDELDADGGAAFDSDHIHTHTHINTHKYT